MRAIICKEFANPETLKVTEIPKPEPNDNQVLLRVESTGLGYVDALTISGQYQVKPSLPFIPGNELSGIIDNIGGKVRHLRVGQRVLASTSGGLAEYAIVEEHRCTPIPDSLSHDAAAGLLRQRPDSWQGSHMRMNSSALAAY